MSGSGDSDSPSSQNPATSDTLARSSAPAQPAPGRVGLSRKMLKRPATLVLPGGIVLDVRTRDLSTDGLTLFVPQPVSPGCACSVRFAVSLDRPVINLTAPAKATSCTLAGVDGFRVGLVFVDLDSASAQAIGAFLK